MRRAWQILYEEGSAFRVDDVLARTRNFGRHLAQMNSSGGRAARGTHTTPGRSGLIAQSPRPGRDWHRLGEMGGPGKLY